MKNKRQTKKAIDKQIVLGEKIKNRLSYYEKSDIKDIPEKDDELNIWIEEFKANQKRIEKKLGEYPTTDESFAAGEGARLGALINSKDRKKPIIKLKNKGIKLGSVVFLKNQDDINEEYDSELKELINTHHRFAIGVYFGPKYNALAVHLLSTSEYVNEINRCGCKLRGDYSDYGNGKQVYLDLQKAFVIKKSCIANYEYDLITVDANLLEDNMFTSNGVQTIYVKGMFGSGVIDMEFDNYNSLNNCRYCQDIELDEIKFKIYKLLIEKLEYNKISKWILLESPSTIGEIYDIAKRLKIYADEHAVTLAEKNDIIKTQIYNLVYNTLKKEQIIKIADYLRRGYRIDE